MERQNREFYWDFVRAVYLLLGVPFHVAVSYSTHFEWSVPSPDRSPMLTVFVDTLHVFRMPGFFMIAGYFSIMLLCRQGVVRWLKSRLIRLGVPLITATVLILPAQMAIQTYAEVYTDRLQMDAFWPVLQARLTHFDEPWISHLWFLYILIGLSIGVAVLAGLLHVARFTSLYRTSAEFLMRYWPVSILAVALICAGFALILPELEVLGGSKFMALLSYLHYTPFFVLGGAVFLSPEVKARYLSAGGGVLLAGLGLAYVATLPAGNVWMNAAFMLAGFLGALMATAAIAHLAKRHFDHPNRSIRNIADASFTIYLFHHPIIFVLAMYFARVDLPPVLEFAILTPLTVVLSYGVHKLIAAHPVTAFLFNGVRLNKAKETGVLTSGGKAVLPTE